jgi:hypothetical protein
MASNRHLSGSIRSADDLGARISVRSSHAKQGSIQAFSDAT